jgi:toxin HigB-1
VIESFRNKGLKELFETGRSSKVAADLRKRVTTRLDALEAATTLAQLNQPGFRLHQLKPSTRWAIDVNGPWRITFEWQGGKATAVDLEQYH